MRAIRRIINIHKVDKYKVYCLFNNGASRIIDFKALFKSWKVSANDIEYRLSQNIREFNKVKLIDGTLTWPNNVIEGVDENGRHVQYAYDIDPIVLYECSDPDPNRGLQIGMLIKSSRKSLGLTQEELARRSGTSKYHISRIENNKTGIEFSTLLKIVEGGLGKRLKINLI